MNITRCSMNARTALDVFRRPLLFLTLPLCTLNFPDVGQQRKVRIGDWIFLACVGVCLCVSLGTCCNCDIFTVDIFRLQTSYRYFAGYQVVSSDIHGCHGPNKTYSVNQNAFWFPVSNFLPVQVCIFQVSSMIQSRAQGTGR